jgi:hypothetical protein
MSAPLISIIIDNFNYARFLTQCIDSALAQTYPNIEVIVVDDASTDHSRDIIERYGDRLAAVMQPTNRGQGAAFNAGFRASRGDIVVFLDSDDWLYPRAVERIVASWQPGASKTHFRLDLVDVAGGPIDVHPPLEVRMDGGDVVPLLLQTGRYETSVTSGNAFARAALEQSMPVPEETYRLCADGYVVSIVPFHGPVTTLDERLGAYRQHGRNGFSLGATEGTVEQLCLRLGKCLDHDADKDRSLLAKAAGLGMPMRRSARLRDPTHLEVRLASLRLGPAQHRYPADSRVGLALRGVVASRRARVSAPRQLVLALWFMVAGLLPLPLASRAIRWRLVPGSRPVGVDRSLKQLRRLLG